MVQGQLPSLQLPGKYESRFGLLGAFGGQFGGAWERCGGSVGAPIRAGGEQVFLFFNNPPSPEALHQWMGPVLGPRAVLQWCVDHPLTIPPAHLDRFVSIPQYRLLTVADDDTHLLPLRFPAIKTARVWHGVDESALCAPDAVHAERPVDLVIAGSIAGDDEIAALRARVPGSSLTAAHEIVALRTTHPHLSFGQAWDIGCTRLDSPTDHWSLMAGVFQYTTALVNRARRTALVRAVQGVKTTLLGTPTLKALCTGTVEYGGEVAYADLPAELAKAKVCLALGPTQFAHSFSERILLSLAAGCATVADDRVCVQREFGAAVEGVEPVSLFDAAKPEQAREQIESLLKDTGRRTAMGSTGRSIVASRHLWSHRVEQVAGLARETLRPT